MDGSSTKSGPDKFTQEDAKTMQTAIGSAAIILSTWLHANPSREEIRDLHDHLLDALPDIAGRSA